MSIQYSIEKTKASLQELANDLFASNFLKSGIEVVDFIVNAVDKLSNVITGPGVIGVGLVLKQMILHFDKILKFVKDKDFANLPKRMSDLGKAISSVQKISATASNVDQLAKATENLTIKSTALILSQQGVEKSIAAKVLVTKGATEADAEAALAAAGYTVAAEGAETVTVSWSAALKGLWASMAPAIAAAAPFLAIAGALGAGIIIAKNYNRAMEEIGSTARKVGDEYKEYTESIKSYKEEITSLKTDLESNTLSYDEARSARERLIEIQKELIEKYGEESEGLNILSDDLDKINNKLDTMSSEKWNELYNNFANANLPGLDSWVRAAHNAADNAEVIVSEMESTLKHLELGNISSDLESQIQDIIQGTALTFNRDAFGFTAIESTGSLQEYYDTLIKIENVINKDVDPRALRSIISETENAKAKLEEYGEFYNQYVFQKRVLPNYESIYQGYIDAYKKYNDALIDDDKETAQEQLKVFSSLRDDLQSKLSENKNQAEVKSILDFFDNLFPEINDRIKNHDFEINFVPNIKTNLDGVDKTYDEVIKEVQNSFKNIEELQVIEAGAEPSPEAKQAWDDLVKISEAYGISLSDIIALLKQRNVLESQSNKDLKAKIVTDMANSETKAEIQAEVNELEEYLETELKNAENLDIDLSQTVFGNINLNDCPLLEWTEENLESSRAALESWHPNIPWEQLKEEFEGGISTVLGSSDTFDVHEGEIDIAFTPLLNTGGQLIPLEKDTVYTYINQLLSELPDTWDTEDLLKLDEIGLTIEGQHIKGLLAEVGTEAQKVADAMHFNGADGAIEGTKTKLEELKTTLQNMANTNWADEAIKNQLASSLDQFQAEGGSLDIISQNLDLFYSKLREKGDASVGTIKIVVDEIEVLNNTPINPQIDTDKIKTLQEEIKSAYESYQKLMSKKITSSNLLDSILDISKAIKSMGGEFDWSAFKEGKVSIEDLGRTVEELANQQIQALISQLGLANTEFGEFLAQTISSAAQTEAAMGQLNTNIDSLQSAYSTLKDVVDTYNESGYITLDQLQSLLELEPQYLQCLFDENGQLNLNNEALMQMALMRIDDAEATYLEEAAKEMDALAANAEAEAIQASAGAMSEASTQASTLSGNLDAVTNSANAATTAMNNYNAALGRATAAGVDPAAIQEIDNRVKGMQNTFQKMRENVITSFNHIVTGSKKAAGAAKGAGNAAKDAADKTKEATNELQKLSSELDDIQSAWKKLDDIQKSYAETGKITVDQAQELINTDYRYLAMLNMEGDAMTVNQAAFETLTEAKLNEMKITLIRNAIDLVNTFKDEAVAAEYVANSYLNMGSAAAQATAQVQALQAAVAGLQATGSATQAQAAGLVMQGTMNALSMLNHVDMSTGLGSNAATSATSGSDPEDAAEEVEEAIEEQTEEVKNMFNWIDRLLERLSRRTEKWMNKAERFFSWWKKNEMVNKAIKSGRGEIKQTNRAYSYYLAQAQAYDLDPKYKKKVEKGEVWIDNITDDDLADKIRDYQELWEQIKKCKDSLDELYNRERELIYQKLDNIVEYFDNIQNYYETMAAKFESRLSVDEAWGNKISFTDLLKVYQMNAEAIRSFDEELFALQTGLSKETSRPSEEVFSDIENKNVSLEDTDLYSRINQNIKDLASDREYYDSLIARREELKKAIKEATDKASKKELQAELKELKKEIKANKPSKENQKAYKAQTNITEGFSTILGTSDYYDTAVSERNRLLEQQTKYNELKKQIAEKKAQIAEAASKEEQQQLKNELKNLKKEAKDAKLNKKDQKTLKALESQVEATERIRDDALVDSEVASSAAYQELLKKIGKLQNKETLSPNQEKKLAMYLDELDAINQGVLVENLTGYMQVYERWWQLKNKENLSVGEWKELEHLETRKQAIEQKFRDEVDRLREEYEDSLMVEGKTPADLQRNFEKEKKEIEDSYNKQIDNLENGYMNSPYYEDLISKINDTEEWIEDYESHSNKWRKNHGFTEEDYEKKLKKLDKLKSTEAALHEGATEQNIDNYIKDWKTVYKYQAAFDSGTLSNKNGERDAYMAAKKRIDNWNQNKQRDVQLLKDQLDEEVENLRKYYNEKIASAETSQNEKLAEQAGIAKQLVELEVSQIQAMIDNLDAVINRYQSIAHLLEQTSLDNIKKYNLMSLFGLEDNKSVTELITDQLTSAVASSESKISQSVTKINLLQELVDAADEGGFEGIFEKYLETASEENAKWINELIDELNSNVKSTGSWVADWNQQISETTDELINTVGNIQTLKDEFRENVMFKAVKNAIEQLDQLNSRLNSMASIIQDNWTTIDGNLTEFGLAKLNLLGQEIGNSQEQVKYWQEQIALIDEAWNNDMSKYGSEEEYIKAKNEAVTSYYSAIQGLGNLENQVYQLAKKAQEEEINRLKELTNSRLKALAAKKKLYEYDKSLKGKTKDVEALEAQIAALNGVSTAAAKAQRAQLEAQLAEAKQSREDLITEHTFELQTDALQALLDDFDKTLTDTAKSIKETFEEFADVVSNALAKAGSADVDSSLGKILSLYMGSGYTPVSATTGISESTRTVNDEPIYYESYKYTPVSQSDYLTSLNANALDANLYLSEWQNSLNNIYSLLDDKLSYLNNIQTNNSNNVNVTLNYDNLINVTGSVDAAVVKDLEKLSKDIVIQTKKSLAEDLRKLGVARSY